MYCPKEGFVLRGDPSKMGRFLRTASQRVNTECHRGDPSKIGIYHKKGPVEDGKISYDAGDSLGRHLS